MPASPNPLRRPPGLPYWKNSPGSTIDPQMLELARNERWYNAGVGREAFRVYNVAVLRIRIGERIDYLEAGNFPRRYGGLMHSEEYLLSQARQMSSPARPVVPEQLFSERIPCRNQCMPKIEREWPNLDIFYSVRTQDHHLSASRAQQLAMAYGWQG